MEDFNLKNPRNKGEIIADLEQEEKIEEDLISIYSILLESGISACLEADLVDNIYSGLTTLKNESLMHRKVVASILKKYA